MNQRRMISNRRISGLGFKYTCSLPFAPTIVHAMMSPSLPRRALAASARLNTNSWAWKSSPFVAYELAEVILARQMMLSWTEKNRTRSCSGLAPFQSLNLRLQRGNGLHYFNLLCLKNIQLPLKSVLGRRRLAKFNLKRTP